MKKLLVVSSFLALGVGALMVLGGVWAVKFTYQNVSREHIVTPDDAAIPNTLVSGPFTLKAQADIIRTHALRMTDGETYAEMPRQIAKVDEEGDSVLDDDGKPVMIPNEARNIWITVTTLTTALHLGIVTYLFSGFIILFGLVSMWTGIVFRTLSKKY
jgi:hypothetical protein